MAWPGPTREAGDVPIAPPVTVAVWAAKPLTKLVMVGLAVPPGPSAAVTVLALGGAKPLTKLVMVGLAVPPVPSAAVTVLALVAAKLVRSTTELAPVPEIPVILAPVSVAFIAASVPRLKASVQIGRAHV